MTFDGKNAFITGAGSGIGKALAWRLAQSGCNLTLVDIQQSSIQSLAAEIRQKHNVKAEFKTCDVTSEHQQKAAFDFHTRQHGSLDFAVLNAGILERGNILSNSDGGEWQQTLDIDLKAQIVGARLAMLAMQATNSKGVILFNASASALFPMPPAPVYAASKAGLLSFANSIAPRLIKRGIRVCTLCPQFVDTPMTHAVAANQPESSRHPSNDGSQSPAGSTPLDPSAVTMIRQFGDKLLTVNQVVEGAMYLLGNEDQVGTALLLHHSGKSYEWKINRQNMRLVNLTSKGRFPLPQLYDRKALKQWALSIPSFRRKVQVHKLSNDFREATKVVSEKIPDLKPGEVLVRRLFAGVNASDINFTSGRYFGKPEVAQKMLPFDAGFEAVGVVAAIGQDVKRLKVGDQVAEMTYGGFSEWAVVKEKLAIPVPACSAEIIGLLTTGLTASIGLELVGELSSDETVLVTAAAGGTGQLVVQLAKQAGNHVIATCGGKDKAELLRKLGADRVINYREESVKDVLRKEYPKGVNLVWEAVGGEMFETCVKALSDKGRIVVIGMMSQYSSGWKPSVSKGLLELLLTKSASVRGFFLPHYTKHYKRHLSKLAKAWLSGQLYVALDPAKFIGAESCVDAVEHLQSGKSVGKVTVQLTNDLPSHDPRANL